MDVAISPSQLKSEIASAAPPLVIDVRRGVAFTQAQDMAQGALRRDPATIDSWVKALPATSNVVVYCVHGHEVSQNAAKALRDHGLRARFLDHGLEGWREAGGALHGKPAGAATRWVTRERPKVDRIACPWLIHRFVDAKAEFLYVPTSTVKTVAAEQHAEAYDIPDCAFTHDGAQCSFDAFLKAYRLNDPALVQLADIVRGADTACLELAPQAAGLVALSLGLSRLFADDHEMLQHGMVMYDALYLWCKEGRDETRTWNPEAYR